MSISTKLTELNTIKQDIKEAIENKGADLTGVDFGGYAGKIDEIETGGGTTGGYNVFVNNNGGGNHIEMLVEFSDGKGLHVSFPWGLPNGIYFNDIDINNVVWLKVISYEYFWSNSTGITETQATEGYTLTRDVRITIGD